MSEEAAPYRTAERKRIRTVTLQQLKERGERFSMLTSYDMYTAEIFDEAGIGIVRGARFTSSYRPEGNMACAANNRRIVFRLP